MGFDPSPSLPGTDSCLTVRKEGCCGNLARLSVLHPNRLSRQQIPNHPHCSRTACAHGECQNRTGAVESVFTHDGRGRQSKRSAASPIQTGQRTGAKAGAIPGVAAETKAARSTEAELAAKWQPRQSVKLGPPNRKSRSLPRWWPKQRLRAQPPKKRLRSKKTDYGDQGGSMETKPS